MIGRGRYNDIFLYEVTEQDLLLEGSDCSSYCVGNVLLFRDKRAVGLGGEFACADDLAAAKEYLDEDGKSLRSLTLKIEQRDELLRDLSESLKSQEQVNSLLHSQLEQARKQLAVDELRHSEMVDDLQSVSVETQTIETTLERVMEEKYRLEEELAERITELLDLNLQNDELRHRLIETRKASEAVSKPDQAGSSAAQVTPTTATPLAEVPASATAAAVLPTLVEHATGVSEVRGERRNRSVLEDTRVITMASGKQIHIMHEFPSISGRTIVTRFGRSVVSGLRVAAIILFVVLIAAVGSIFATAQVNGIPYGAALDLILGNLGLVG